MVKIEISIDIQNTKCFLQVDKLVREDWKEIEVKIATAVEKRLDRILTKAMKETKNINVTRIERITDEHGES